MQKCKKYDIMCLEKNVEKQPASLEISQKYFSSDINNSQIGDQMLKICLPKCKIEPLTLIVGKFIKKASKLNITYTTMIDIEPSF